MATCRLADTLLQELRRIRAFGEFRRLANSACAGNELDVTIGSLFEANNSSHAARPRPEAPTGACLSATLVTSRA